jgi:lipopolysaccharide/colanic/teichoic acid biosynthesis glycosyltransferase
MENSFAPILAKLPQPLRRKIEPEQDFLLRIAQECRRAERSGQRFLLVLIGGVEARLEKVPVVVTALAALTRETDTYGWYEDLCTLGILFAELGGAKPEDARVTIVEKIQTALRQAGCAEGLSVSIYVLPHDLNEQVKSEDGPNRISKFLEMPSSPSMKLQLGIKRVIDLVGSVSLLIAFLPLMVLIALAVKCGSQGPVFFRQIRVGQGGRHFTFLKFRSMAAANDCSLHENYVKQFIRGTASKNTNEKGEGVFKLTEDPRVTHLGRLLRRTSMDELPQLWNVLRGEMSLVGPRPPIPYEVECYDLWHQRRVLELKPGITGLWQVRGRSRTGFNDMVRLDLLYARRWSLWLDFKILLQTPFVVFGGGGAH